MGERWRDTYVVVLWPLIQDTGWQGYLKRRPSNTLHKPLRQHDPNRLWEITTRPPAKRRIKHDRVQPRHPHIPQILPLQSLGVTQRSAHEPLGKRIHAPQVAQVELQAEHMDATDRVLPVVRVADAGSQRGRCLGGVRGVVAEGADRVEGFGLGACGWEEDEVRGEGASCEEFINDSLSNAQPDATVKEPKGQHQRRVRASK